MGFKYGNLEGTRRPFHVGIGTQDASAQLQADATDKGFLPPRMTTVQRVAIATPAEGLLAFDTDYKRLFIFQDGAWSPVESNGINEDLTLYVDGTSGNDSNDGLTWGTAKKTFGFLLADEPDSLSREINAAVVINWRNNVRARSSKGLLGLEGFYGYGSITIQGTMTAVETFTATGYNNDRTVRGSRQWVSDATKAWTPNQWRRHFVNLGHSTYFPIHENDATTLWMGFGKDQSGSYASTIYSAPELLRELDGAPGAKFDFDLDKFIFVRNCNLTVTLIGMWIDEDSTYPARFEFSKETHLQYISSRPPLFNHVGFSDVLNCYFNHTNYGLFYVNEGEVFVGNTAFDSTDSTGYGIYILDGGNVGLVESWLGNQLFAVDVVSTGVFYLNREIYVQDCDVGLFLEGAKLFFATPEVDQPQLRFDTVATAIVGMGDIIRQAEFGILGWSVTKEFVFSDTDTGSFAAFTAATLQSRHGLRLYYSDASYAPILLNEYDNTASGLAATRYQTAIDEMQAHHRLIETDMKEPTGFPFNDQFLYSRISFNNALQRATIEPAFPPFSSFHFWVQGTKFTKTTAQTVDIPDTEGLHGIYFDTDGVLKVATNPDNVVYGQLQREKALVAWVYWDADNNQQIYFSNERHGMVMDGLTHESFHWRFGMYLNLGGELASVLPDESGALASHAQFGTVFTMSVDEDVTHFANPIAATTGLPIYYRSGVSGLWRRELNAGFSVLTTGTGRLAWNQLTGGSWGKTEASDDSYVLCHVFTTNDTTYKYFAVMGQAEYATLALARAAAAGEMNTLIRSAFPQQEWFACGTVIFQTKDTYGNAVKARVRRTAEGDDYLSWISRKITPRSPDILLHNDMDGLNVGDYKHLVATDLTQLTTNIEATNHFHIPTIANFRTVGQVGSQCDYTPTLGYGAIAAACAEAKASGVTPANPWVVQVYPGVYPEPKFTLVPGLYLVCAQVRMDSVFIVAIDPTDDLIVMDGGGHIFGPHLIGVSTVGKYLINCSSEGGFSSLMDLAIHSCSGGLLVANGHQTVGTNIAMIIGGPANNIGLGLNVTGTGTFTGTPSFLAMQGFFANVSPLLLGYYANNPIQRVASITAGAQLFVATGSFRVAAKDNTADVIFADNGGFAFLSAVEMASCETALHIGSVGTSEILTQACNFQDNTLDVKIESATGRIFFNNTVDTLTSSIVAGAKIIGNIQSRDAESMAIVGSAKYQYLLSGRQVDFADFFADYTSTGVCEGGEVTAATGLHVDVAAGEGWVRRGTPNNDSKWVEWVLTEDLDLTASNTNYIYVDGSDGVVKATLTPISYGDSILLATVVTDGSGIRFLHKTRNYLTAPWEQLKTYLLATRKLALNTGLTFLQGTGVRNIDVGAGSYYRGLDLISYAGGDDVTWSYFYGPGGATEVSGVTQVNITDYDLAGVLTDMQAGWFRADTLVLTSDGRLSLIYGTVEYETQPEAEAALQANLPTFIEITGFPLCNVIVEEGVGIASFVDLRAQPGSSTGGGGTGGVSVHSLLAGLTSDDHPHYALVDGTRSMSGDLNMGTKNITNVGTVDGVDVSSHGALHNPGGLQALATATPVSIGTANAEGAGANYARGNHVHDHGSQSTSTHHAVASAIANGFMSAAHFTKVETGIPDYAQYVTVAKSGGDYTDPATALAAIVDATASKRYCLQIFPGEYSVNLTLKDYVDIIGAGPPRSVVLKSSSGTVITMSNANRADLRNLTVQRTSTTNNEHAIEMTAGTHLIYDCVVEQFSTDAYGCLIHASGTGTLQLNTGQYTLVQTGTSSGAGNNNVIVHSEGSTVLLVRGINVALAVEDADDNAIAFLEESVATGTVLWQNSFIDINVTAPVFSGTATAIENRSTVLAKYLTTTKIALRKSVGGATGTGKAYACNSLAGGAFFKSTHNVIDVTGFANNYFADIDTGDQIITEFDSVSAVNGAIGAGSVNNEDGAKLLHGVYSRTTAPGLNCLPTHITTTTFTLGATANPIRYYYRGVNCVVSADKTATLDDGAGGSTAGLYWVYFNRATGTILATKSAPGFTPTSNIVIATVAWNGSDYGLVSDERHGYTRDTEWHAWAHTTVGTRYRSGFDFVPTGTGLGATFTMSAGELWDEDIAFSALASASWPSPHALRTLYQTGVGVYTFDKTLSTTPFKAGGAGRPMYVNLSGYALTQASSAVNRYFNFFIYGTPDLHTPVYCVTETVPASVAATNGYTSLAATRAVGFPSLSGVGISQELKPLYRLIVRADGAVQALTAEEDYRLVSSLPMAAGVSGTTASAVTFTPAGDISSANVQLALEELDTEKAPLASPTFTGTVTAPAVKLTTGATLNHVLTSAADGTASWAAPAVPATVTVADTTDASCNVALFESATGDLAPKTDASLTYNASTGELTAASVKLTTGAVLNHVLTSAADGVASWAAPAVPATITVADTADASCNVALFEDATGNLGPKTDAGLTYNATTGQLSATSVKLTSGAVLNHVLTSAADGVASWAAPAVPASITVADTADASCSVALFEDPTGNLGPKTDANLTYNASTGQLTAASVKLTTGAVLNHVLTSAADGTASWVAPAAVPAFEASTANILMDGSVSVGDTATVPRANHRHPTDTTRLAATRGNWKTFHSDGSGVFQEIAVGAVGTVLKGGGVAAAPSFGTVPGAFTVFNVKDYGAVGNGVADDTTAIRDTLTAAAAVGDRGATIYFPGGTYQTTGTITVNDFAITFRGPGMGAAMINPTSTNIPVFQLTSGNEFITFRDLEFGTITAQVAGSSFIDTNGANNVLIDRVNMFGWFYGIYIRGGSGKVTVSNVQLKDGVATNGVGIYIDNSTATDVNLGPWVMVTNAAGAKPLAGILIKAAGGFAIHNVTVNNTTHGIQLYPSSGSLVQYGRITDCVFDLAGTNGAYLYTPNQASPGQVRSIKFIGCLFSNANAAGTGYGITLEGASNGVMDAVSFDSCRIVGNGRHGINYLFGSNIRVNGSTIAGNSASASNTYDGISVAAAVSDFEVLNNRIGQSGPAANTQRYAVNIAAGASNRYQIVGNDVGTNNTAPFILDGGTGVFKRILQNGNAMPISHMPALSAAMQSLAVSANLLTGSLISLPVNSLLVGTRICWEIVLIKTAAGTATWDVQVKFGTNGTTADASIANWTSGTNTAAIDQARLRIVCDILTLGGSATARCNAFYVNTLTNVTGLGRINGAPTGTATFNSAASPAYIHIGVTPGASAVMTAMCEAQIIGAG